MCLDTKKVILNAQKQNLRKFWQMKVNNQA